MFLQHSCSCSLGIVHKQLCTGSAPHVWDSHFQGWSMQGCLLCQSVGACLQGDLQLVLNGPSSTRPTMCQPSCTQCLPFLPGGLRSLCIAALGNIFSCTRQLLLLVYSHFAYAFESVLSEELLRELLRQLTAQATAAVWLRAMNVYTVDVGWLTLMSVSTS